MTTEEEWHEVTLEEFTSYVNDQLTYIVEDSTPDQMLVEVLKQFDGTDNLAVELHDELPYSNILEFTKVSSTCGLFRLYQFTGMVQSPTLDWDKKYFRFMLDDDMTTLLEEVRKPWMTLTMSILWALVFTAAWKVIVMEDRSDTINNTCTAHVVTAFVNESI
jgi:hypothetical protein